MAKNRRRRKDDGIKGFIIAFVAIMVALSGALLWNSYNLSAAGRVDGERIPRAFHNFFWDEAANNLMWQLMMQGMAWGDEAEQMVNDAAFNHVTELFVAKNQFNALGLQLTAQNELDIELRLGELRAQNPQENLRALGLNDNLLERLATYMIKHQVLVEHIGQQMPAPEGGLAHALNEAFTEFISNNLFQIRHVYVYMIEVGSEEFMRTLFNRVMFEDFLELMREYSLFQVPNLIEVESDDEDEEPTEFINVLNTPVDFETVALIYEMEPGDMTMAELDNGNFAIFKVSHIEGPIDIWGAGITTWEELEEIFKDEEEQRLRTTHFNDQMFIWREQANIVPNNRVVRR